MMVVSSLTVVAFSFLFQGWVKALGQLTGDDQQHRRDAPVLVPVFHTCDGLHEYWDEVSFN